MAEVEKASLATAVAHGSIGCEPGLSKGLFQGCAMIWTGEQGAVSNIPDMCAGAKAAGSSSPMATLICRAD